MANKNYLWIGIAVISVLAIFIIFFISNSIKPTGNVVVCNSPYIQVGTICCLDENYNGICDNDEQPAQQKTQEEQVEDFSFRIEEVGYDCLVNELPRSSSPISIVTTYLDVEKSSDDKGVVDNIIISYPKDSELPNGEWKIDTKILTSSGNPNFENSASFNSFSIVSCISSNRNCFSPFAYDIIASPYIKGGSVLVTVTSPSGKIETKEVPLPSGDCNVLSLNGEQLFSVVKASFINHGFTLDNLNPSEFEGHSDGGLFYGGGAYSDYQISLADEGYRFFSHIYYFDNVYKTTAEELAEEMNELDYISATLISTPNGKYIRSGSEFVIICGHKAIIDVPIDGGVSESDVLNVVEEILLQCN